MSNQISTGFICRGVLVGYQKTEETYTDKHSGERKKVTVHLLGILRSYTNKYNRAAEMVVDLRIPNKLAENAQFMASIDSYFEMLVEVELSGLTDYPNKRHFLDSNAKISPCGANLQAVNSAA